MTTILPAAAAAPVLKVKANQLVYRYIGIRIGKGSIASEPEKQ
jgi:hypothetical protein